VRDVSIVCCGGCWCVVAIRHTGCRKPLLVTALRSLCDVRASGTQLSRLFISGSPLQASHIGDTLALFHAHARRAVQVQPLCDTPAVLLACARHRTVCAGTHLANTLVEERSWRLMSALLGW
jgi:hypothetical protein